MAVVTPPALSTVPPFPALSDRAAGTYNSKAYTFGTYFSVTFNSEFPALANNVANNATDAQTSAAIATAQAAIAAAQAAIANAQAAIATAQAAIATDKAAEAAASAAVASEAAAFSDAAPVVKNTADTTKKIRFALGAITTGTTRVLSAQDKDGILALMSDFSTPPPIGSATPNAVTATSLNATGLITATGGQIKFPATQVPSADPNTLDDYEEGTWTPSFALQTPGTSSFTYSAQTGCYTKKGREVTLQFALTVSAAVVGTGSGNLVISGAPFVAGLLTQSGAVSYSSGYLSAFPTTVEIAAGASALVLLSQPASSAGAIVTAANVGAQPSVYGSITYFV